MSLYEKLRSDTSIAIINLKRPRINALYSSSLGKYVVSFTGTSKKNELRKLLGFKDQAFFSIIVDLEEEVYYYVANQKVVKACAVVDVCDVTDSGDSFSVFWRNQREPDREFRLYLENGCYFRFTRRGAELIERTRRIED